MDQQAQHILSVLEDAGYAAYCVGGCVRDTLMGRTPSDWDIATAARPEVVKSLFPHTVDTGLKHGTVTVLLDHRPYEVTTYRVEGAYHDSRRPDSVRFVDDIQADLARRDFTVNAMASSPTRGLCDPFGGQADIARRIIRCVGDARTRFTEDALRMLRAVRFAVTLGFTLEADTAAAICACAPRITHISAERIREELNKILLSADPKTGLVLLHQTGLLAQILPEVEACAGVAQHIKYHLYDVFTHTCIVVAHTPPTLPLRWAALLHDVGKPPCKITDEDGVDHFYGHAAKSVQMAREILTRLRFDNATRAAVLTLVEQHDCPIVEEKRAVKRAMRRVGEDWFLPLLALKRADCSGQNPAHTAERPAYYDRLEAMYHAIIADNEAFSLRDLAVNGHDMQALGFCGKEIGAVLDWLLADVLDHPEHNDRATLLALAAAFRDKN